MWTGNEGWLETEWTSVHRKTVTHTQHRCSHMVACSVLTSGSGEPPPDISQAPWEVNIPSQLGKIWKRRSPPTVASVWRNALAFVPSQHVRKSWGSYSIGGEDRNSRGQGTLWKCDPNSWLWSNAFFQESTHDWSGRFFWRRFFSSKFSLSLQPLQGTAPVSSLRPPRPS